MQSPANQRTVRQPISVRSRMPKDAKERTALIRYTAQGSVTISVSRKQNCPLRYDQQRKVFTKQMQDKLDEYEAENRLPDEELSAFYEKMKQDVMGFVYALEAEAE